MTLLLRMAIVYGCKGGSRYRNLKEDPCKPTVTRIRTLAELLQPDALTKLLRIIKNAL